MPVGHCFASNGPIYLRTAKVARKDAGRVPSDNARPVCRECERSP